MIDRINAGDKEALRRFMEENAPYIYRCTVLCLPEGSEELRREATRETLKAVTEAARAGRCRKDVPEWLLSLCREACEGLSPSGKKAMYEPTRMENTSMENDRIPPRKSRSAAGPLPPTYVPQGQRQAQPRSYMGKAAAPQAPAARENSPREQSGYTPRPAAGSPLNGVQRPARPQPASRTPYESRGQQSAPQPGVPRTQSAKRPAYAPRTAPSAGSPYRSPAEAPSGQAARPAYRPPVKAAPENKPQERTGYVPPAAPGRSPAQKDSYALRDAANYERESRRKPLSSRNAAFEEETELLEDDLFPDEEEDLEEEETEGRRMDPLVLVMILVLGLVVLILGWMLIVMLSARSHITPGIGNGFADWFNAKLFKFF